jgi:ATP-dependent DNA ligase
MAASHKTKRKQPSSGKKTTAREVGGDDPLSSLPDAPASFFAPMQAKLVDRLPVGEQWRYELKLDGYRAIAIKMTSGVNLISRNERQKFTCG